MAVLAKNRISHLSRASENHRSDKYRLFCSKHAAQRFLSPIKLCLTRQPPYGYSDNNTRLTRQEEVQLFEALHYVKYHLHKVLNNGHRRLLQWSRLYYAIRNRIISANIALVYKCIELSKISSDVDSLKGFGYDALIRSVEGFDPWRGFKFSTYACNSIYRSFCKIIDKKKLPIIDDADPDIARAEKSHSKEQQALYQERLQIIMRDNTAGMTEREQFVLNYRFGESETLGAVGLRLGVSKERVRQIQMKAFQKIEKVLVNDPVLR